MAREPQPKTTCGAHSESTDFRAPIARQSANSLKLLGLRGHHGALGAELVEGVRVGERELGRDGEDAVVARGDLGDERTAQLLQPLARAGDDRDAARGLRGNDCRHRHVSGPPSMVRHQCSVRDAGVHTASLSGSALCGAAGSTW